MACGSVACGLIASYEYATLHAMDTQDDRAEEIVRTTVMVPRWLDTAIREMAEKNDRPLSREIRQALKAHVGMEEEAA